MSDNDFPRRFEAAGRMGARLRTIAEGVLSPYDAIGVSFRLEQSIILRSTIDALGDTDGCDDCYVRWHWRGTGG